MVSASSNIGMVTASLEKAKRDTLRTLKVEVPAAAREVRDLWRENANASSHAYSQHYQRAIDVRPGGYLTSEIAPWSGRQSNMAFEFGDHNHPPHLDGQRALDSLTSKIQRRLGAAADSL